MEQQHHHHRRTARLHHLEVPSMSKSSGVADNESDLHILESSMSNLNMSSGSKTLESSSHCDIWRMTSPSEIATKLVLMTQAPRICFELRNEGILPLLVQFLHQHSTEDGMLALITGDHEIDTSGFHQQQQVTGETFRSTLALRRASAKALRNIVTHTAKSKKDVEILGLLEDLRSFVEIFYLKWSEAPVEAVDHPCSQLAEICAFACDSNYRKTIELFGGVYVIADVIQSDYRFHRSGNSNEQCFLLRQYSLNVLTQMTAQNLDTVKSVLGSMRPFIGMLVETLQQASKLDNLPLMQSVANVLHNLSWKSDFNSRQIMRDVKTVDHLAKMAMATKDFTTLKALLEPLLNLTAHCTPNKVDFCKIEGVLDFLISKLKTAILPSTSSSSSSSCSSSTSHLNSTELAIVENSGGILRNIASYLVTQEDLTEQLRAWNIVAILLDQLKSPSLAIVSNACITLSYLVACSPKDALQIKELGGIQILHGLTNSKHEPIKLGASKTLQHLYTSHLANHNATFKESPAMTTSYSISNSFQMSKLNAFKTGMSSFQSESYDHIQSDISPNDSLNHSHNINSKTFNMSNSLVHSNGSNNFHPVTRSSSQDSINSTHSEPGTKNQSAEQESSTLYMNLVNSGTSPLDHRQMIPSYSGQAINSIYATLPANSRIRQKHQLMEKDTSDISSCSLIKSPGNPKNSNSTTDYLEEEEDPAPTDYSQRFKEQVIDDFSTPQSASKTDTSTSEDTVKVYQTENTPLVFSLAPSLSDLRDFGNGSAGSGMCSYPAGRLVENSSTKHDLSDSFNSLELNGKSVQHLRRPVLAPKPPAKLSQSSASAYNLKIPYSINEEAAVEVATTSNKNGQPNKLNKPNERSEPQPTPSQQYNRSRSMGSILYNNDNYGQSIGANTENNWTSKSPSAPRWSDKPPSSGLSTPLCTVIANSVNRQADSLEHLAAKDSAQLFATENTPAFFSHATSLSSLSMEDDQLDEVFPSGQLQQQQQKSDGAQVNSSLQNQSDTNTSDAAYQNYSTGNSIPSPDQRSKSPSSASQGKPTPVAAKRMSKSQTAQNSSEQSASSAVPFYSEQRSPSPPPRPPKKPLPAIPRGESPPRIHAPLPPTPTSPTTPETSKDDDYDDFIYKCRQAALPKETIVKLKTPSSSNMKSPYSNTVLKNQAIPNQSPSYHTNSSQSANTQHALQTEIQTKSPNAKASQQNEQLNNITDEEEDDEDLLTKCMQVAINKQSHSHSSRSSSRKATTTSSSHTHSNAPSRESKSPRINKGNPEATVVSASSHHHMSHVLKLPASEPSPVEQAKHFYVEDTPVHFSQCHSPLSPLFDSADEIEDQQLVEAAARFDAARSAAAATAAQNIAVQKQQSKKDEEEEIKSSDESEPESEATSTVINNAAAVAAPARTSTKSSKGKQKSQNKSSEKVDIAYDQVPFRKSPADLVEASSEVIANTNIAGTTAVVARTSHTRTYKRVDKAKNSNTDTMNTEIESSNNKHSFQPQPVSMPLFSNPMDSPKGSKKPPPAPRYKPRPMQLAPSNFELTDDSSDDERFLHFRYSQSLNNRRSATSKNSKNSDVAFVQHQFGNPQFESLNSAVQYTDQKPGQFYPYSNHHQMGFSSLGRRGLSSSGRVKKEKDFEDKNLFYPVNHTSAVVTNQMEFFNQSKSKTQNFKSASKYFDRHVSTFGSIGHFENQYPIENQVTNAVTEPTILLPTSKQLNNNNDLGKPNEKNNEKRSSIFSKLSSPFSSHNNPSNSGRLTPTSQSTKTSLNKINSKIASFWKRSSKSSQDKLDHHEALTVNPSKNIKAAKINKIFPSQGSADDLDVLDLNQNQVTNQLVENTDHPYGVHSNGNRFTFSTFVKTPPHNFSSSVESVSTHSSADRFRSEMNYQQQQQQHQQGDVFTTETSTASSDPNTNSPVDDTSGISSKTSSSGQRKTCLVTTV